MDNEKFIYDEQWLNSLGYQENDGRGLRIEKSCIKIKGLDRVYRFWQFSDMHVSFAFPTDSKAEIARVIERNKFWTQDDGQNCLYMLDRLIEEANAQSLDGVMICGDLIDYYSKSNFRYVKEKLSALRTKFFYAVGNHEGYNDGPQISTRRFYRDYDMLTKGKTDTRIIDYGKFLVLVVDDGDLKMRRKQIELFEKANSYQKPIILVLHIPLLTEGLEPSCMEKWGTKFMLGTHDDTVLTKEFCQKVKGADSNVVAICAGHIHYTNVSEFREGNLQFCNTPALTGFVREIEVCPE